MLRWKKCFGDYSNGLLPENIKYLFLYKVDSGISLYDSTVRVLRVKCIVRHDVYRAGVNKSRKMGSQLSLNLLLRPVIIVGPLYRTCFVSQFWCLEFLDGSMILGKFVNDWCEGVVVYLHTFLKSTLDWFVSWSLVTAPAIFPRNAASDTPLVGDRECHRSRLDALENVRNFALGKESNRAIQSAACMTFSPSGRTQHSPVCRVQYCTNHCRTLM
jgi:hypothetical protein